MSTGAAVVSATAVLAVGMLIGASLGSRPASTNVTTGGSLDEIADLINEHAANQLDSEALREGAVDGMLSALGDPWAAFTPPSTARTAGPEAGVTEVPLHVTAEFLANGIRYVRIDSFADGVAKQVANALSGDKKGVLLDLRENRGGLLQESVDVAKQFLSGGRIVSFTQRGARTTFYEATSAGGDTATPVVVLIDTLTASSAEVLAAALQERGRAVIVGQRSFGKGTVQERFRASDGSVVKLTVGRYQTPSGREIDGIGVIPDIESESSDARVRGEKVLLGLIGGDK